MKYRVISLQRLSTEEQNSDGRAGLLRQEEELRLAATRWNLEIVKRFQIIDVSGTQVAESQIFQDILESLKDPLIRGLVVPAIDRLIRPDDFRSFSIFDFFIKNSKLIFTPSSQINVSEDPGYLEALIQGMMAGLDRRRILRNTQGAKEQKRRLGRCANAKITLPQGVDFDFKTGKWAWVEPHASRMKLAFEMLLSESYSVRAIAKELGYACPRTLYIRLHNPIWAGIREYRYRRGNEKYYRKGGKQADKKKVPREEALHVPINIEPLVSQADFERAQEILSQMRRTWKSSRSAVSRFEFTGFLYCGHCGEKMYSKSAGKRPGRHDYYYCRSQHYGGTGCGASKAQRDQVDFTMRSLVSEFFMQPQMMRSLLDSANQRISSAPLLSDIDKSKAEIEQLEEQKRKLLSLAVRGEFSSQEIEHEAKRINSELSTWTILKRKAERELAVKTISDTEALAQSFASVFSEFEYLQPSERKSLLGRLLSRVHISEGAVTRLALRVPETCDKTGIRTGRDSWPRRAQNEPERSRTSQPAQ